MSRLTEILLALMLFAFGANLVVQFQIQKRLNAILVEIENRNAVAMDTPAPGNPATPAVPSNPGPNPPGPVKPNPTPANPNGGTDEPPNRVTIIPDPPTDPNPTPPDPPKPVDDPDPTPPDPPGSDVNSEWESSRPLVESVIRELLAGEYDSVSAKLDDTMRAAMTRDVMATAMDPIRQKHGVFKRFVGHKQVFKNVPADMRAFAVDTELDDGHRLRFTVSVDSNQRVSSLLAGDVE